MDRVFFARFEQREGAEAMLRDLRSNRLLRKVMIDVVDPRFPLSSYDMPPATSNVWAAAIKGVVGGGLGGLLLGIVLGAFGLSPSREISVPFSVLVGLLGAIAGTLGAVLIGVQDPDQNLERLVTKIGPGEVILSIHAPDLSLEETVVDAVRRAGGMLVGKAGSPIDGLPTKPEEPAP